MSRQRIKVDGNGFDAEGEEYTLKAEQWVVDAGYMVNVPVCLIYPDGSELYLDYAKVTPLGLQHLAEELPKEELHDGA